MKTKLLHIVLLIFLSNFMLKGQYLEYFTGKCLNSLKSQSEEFQIKLASDTLYVDGFIEANCCGSHILKYTIDQYSVNLATVDTGILCKCMCIYPFNFKIGGLKNNSYRVVLSGRIDTTISRGDADIDTFQYNNIVPEISVNMKYPWISSTPIFGNKNKAILIVKAERFTGGCTYKSQIDSIVKDGIYISGHFDGLKECYRAVTDSISILSLESGYYKAFYSLFNNKKLIAKDTSNYFCIIKPFDRVSLEVNSNNNLSFVAMIGNGAQCNEGLRLDSIIKNNIFINLQYCAWCKCLSPIGQSVDLGKLSNGRYIIYYTAMQSPKLLTQTDLLIFNKTDIGFEYSNLEYDINSITTGDFLPESSIVLKYNILNSRILVKCNKNIQKIELFDFNGKCVFSKLLNERSLNIEKTNFANGLYLLRTTIDQKTYIKKIIF